MEQFVSWALPILKFASIGITGVLSVIALLVEFKDKDGEITYWGKRALIGIIVGALIAASSAALEIIKGESESKKDAKEALEIAQSTKTILENINRSLYPLENLEFSFWATVDVSSSELSPFRERFTKKVDSYIEQYSKGNRRSEGMYASHSNKDGPVEISVPVDAEAFPSEIDETLAYYLIRHVNFRLEFYKSPISPSYFEKEITQEDDYRRPDLVIDIGTSEQDGFGIEIDFNINDKSYHVNGSSIKSDPRYWRTNSKIISLPDLNGSQMFVFTDSIIVPSIEEDNSELVALRGGIRLDTLIIDLAGRQKFWFRTENLEEHITPRGLKYFVFSLPNGIEDYAR